METMQPASRVPEQNGDNIPDWKTAWFRTRMTSHIEEAMGEGYIWTSRSPADIEMLIHTKALNRREYMSLVARLIIHLRETRLDANDPVPAV